MSSPRRRRGQRLGSEIGTFGFVLVLGAFSNLLLAWVVMLAMGAAHVHWPQVPAVGYFTTYVLLAGVSCVAAAVRAGK